MPATFSPPENPERVQICPVGFAAAALLVPAVVLVIFPDFDLAVSAQFYRGEGSFIGMGHALAEPVRDALIALYFALVALSILAVWVAAGRKKAWLGLSLRKWLIVAMSLVMGPGLVSNLWLKQHWGRPRPTAIIEFGGSKPFVPAAVPSAHCARHCSFVSGEASSMFVPLFAAAAVVPQLAVSLVAAGTIGGFLAGIVRVSQGAHFLSDVIFAGVLMAMTVIILRWIVDRLPGLDNSDGQRAGPAGTPSIPGGRGLLLHSEGLERG